MLLLSEVEFCDIVDPLVKLVALMQFFVARPSFLLPLARVGAIFVKFVCHISVACSALAESLCDCVLGWRGGGGGSGGGGGGDGGGCGGG